jgi:hypothetical protein
MILQLAEQAFTLAAGYVAQHFSYRYALFPNVGTGRQDPAVGQPEQVGTLVNGRILVDHDELTGERPGRLVTAR